MQGNYLSVTETAKKWKVTPRYIQTLCKGGRIEGAQRFGNAWAIPEDAARPGDQRVKSGKYKNWRKKIKQSRGKS